MGFGSPTVMRRHRCRRRDAVEKQASRDSGLKAHEECGLLDNLVSFRDKLAVDAVVSARQKKRSLMMKQNK